MDAGAGGGACSGAALTGASFATALLAELAGAALGFGPAVLYQISWQLCAVIGIASGALETAVLNIVVEDAPCGLLQLFLLRRHFQPRLFVLFNLPVLATVPLGTFLLLQLGSSEVAKQALGTLLFLVAVLQVCVRRHQEHGPSRRPLEEGSPAASVAIVAAMAVSGLLRGSLGIAGPPVMVLLLFLEVNHDVWRCIANTSRVTMIVLQGTLLGFNNDLQWPQCWPTYTALMLGGLAGLGLGNLLAPKVDQAVFQRWLLLFLTSGALLLLCSGSRSLSAAAAVGVAVSALLVALVPLLSVLLRRTTRCRYLLHVLHPLGEELHEAARTPMVAVVGKADPPADGPWAPGGR